MKDEVERVPLIWKCALHFIRQNEWENKWARIWIEYENVYDYTFKRRDDTQAYQSIDEQYEPSLCSHHEKNVAQQNKTTEQKTE